MKMTAEEIKHGIERGEIKAITLDTSVFEQKQNGLEYGLLRQMEQFNDSITTVVFSDVVLREVESHIRKAASESQTAMKAALKIVGNSWQVPKETRDATYEAFFSQSSPEEVAQKRVHEFVTRTGAETVVAGETVDVHELVDRYFTPKPPFSDKEAKKSEFPDALALMSLERWANDNGETVLVVVRDGDWEAYCDTSERLVAINDLQEALTLFQPQTVDHLCRKLVDQIRSDDPLGFVDAIEQAIYFNLESQFDFLPDADSSFHFEWDWPEVSLEFIGIHGFDDEDFQLEAVTFTDDKLVVALKVDVHADIDCSFDFSTYDSIDKDYVPMGSGASSTSIDLEVDVLVTIVGPMPECEEIEEVEIMKRSVDVDFGYIEPDWMGNPDHEEY